MENPKSLKTLNFPPENPKLPTQKPLKCPLDSEDLPPIGEALHKQDQCLCYLCTCLKHQCPYQETRYPQTASHSFISKYKHDFVKHPYIPYKRVRKIEKFTPVPFKEDYTTTNGKYHTAHSISPKAKLPEIQSENFSHKFSGLSSYRANYLNWGPEYKEQIKKVVSEETCKTPEIGQNFVSNYSASFARNELNMSLDKKRAKLLRERNWESKGIIGSAFRDKSWSSHKIHYKPIYEREKREKIESKAEMFIPSEKWEREFKSTYRSEYSGQKV